MDDRIYEIKQHHLLGLQDNSGFGSDPKSWLSASGDDLSRTLSSLSAAAATASATGNVDRVLFNDLVEMVPLVQSLIDRKASSSFTRRGSVIYTKTPSRESLLKKTDGRSATRPTKKHSDQGDKDQIRAAAENISVISSNKLLLEKDKEELMALRDRVEELKTQLLEKDELLKSAEVSKSEMASVHMKFDDLKNEASEKDSLIKSTQLQLSDVKIKLAEKQASVERLQWEATTSKKEVEKLREDLDKVESEISSFMLLIQGLASNDFTYDSGDYEDVPYSWDHKHDLDYEMDIQKLEAAREAYIAALGAAKEKQDEESIYAAANARLRLQSIVLK